MSFVVAVAALALLMFVAYRGFSVILFAPIAAMLAVLVTDPGAVPTLELSGFSRAIVSSNIGLVGCERAMLAIVLVGAVLTYGGVSLFVAVFALYPFAAEMFRQSDITLLAVTGPTHRDSYRDIFAITCIKTAAVFVVIAVYDATGPV